MIWHIAVYPENQRQGIGDQLLKAAEDILIKKEIYRLEAWTRDDKWVINWYEHNNYEKKETYLHIFMNGGEELKGNIKSEREKLYPVFAFAHYVGENHRRTPHQLTKYPRLKD